MLLNVRTTAMSFSILTFFALSIVSWSSGLPPFTCCKRALGGAVCAYIVAHIGAKLINAILINAMITSKEEEEKANE
ncbi:MAG: hypothetical protein ACYSTX_04155 [Planctomycetota bacterium]|jgi:hypothetical protein